MERRVDPERGGPVDQALPLVAGETSADARLPDSTDRTMRMIGPVPSCSGLAMRPTPVGVRGPPSAGMQPMNGMKLDVRPGGPTEVARKTVSLRVVIPGLTGLPIRPGNST